MNASATDAVARPSEHQSRIRLAGRQRLRNARLVQKLGGGPESEDRLAVPVLILQELQRPAVGGQALNGVRHRPAAPRRRTGPTAPPPWSRRPRSDLRSPTRPLPSRAPTNRGTAPAAVRRSASALSASPSTPSATRMATRRARTLPSPGRANNDSAGDLCYFRRHLLLEHLRHRRRHLPHARGPRPPPRPAPARRSSARRPSVPAPPASAPATARTGRR